MIIVGAPGNGCLEDVRYAHSLEEYARENGLQENILWTGYQQHLDRYYAAMDVLVQPSLAEAMPLTVLEALQRGIPVIASRTGGIPEIVRHEFNGLLSPPDNEDAFVRSLERFVEDQSLRERLRLGAQASIDERFSLATFTRTIHNIVCRLSESDNSNKAEANQKELSAWK
jgi:glycosyltransferase involved in cell wall biosynthesis